jgi:hypothetical protein
MYAMVGTRPDIAYAVSTLSRFTSNPGPSHWVGVKRVLRYLRGTMQMRVTYGQTGVSVADPTKLPLLGYCDAAYASSTDDRLSMTGWVFLVAGGAISWQSRRQKATATSTMEAEYMASCDAAKEAIWLRSMLQELGLQPTGPTTIRCDNQGSIALGKNPEQHQRSKHIDIQYHFVREQVARCAVEYVYIATERMIADQLTKPLTVNQHSRCIRGMGLQGE